MTVKKLLYRCKCGHDFYLPYTGKRLFRLRRKCPVCKKIKGSFKEIVMKVKRVKIRLSHDQHMELGG